MTLELPLPTDREIAERSLVVPRIGNQRFDNDFLRRDLADRTGLLDFGPAPSVDMLLQTLAAQAQVV